jgi:hypothetical protein
MTTSDNPLTSRFSYFKIMRSHLLPPLFCACPISLMVAFVSSMVLNTGGFPPELGLAKLKEADVKTSFVTRAWWSRGDDSSTSLVMTTGLCCRFPEGKPE